MTLRLGWNEGKSLLWQVLGAVGVWAFIVALHVHNNGLWYQGDSSRHAANGVFWWDFLIRLPVNPFQFALSYYARYPVINPTSWPPFFYLLEAGAYRLLGVSPFVAKGLVLLFMLGGTFYLIAWLRRWVGEAAGWGGILFATQPAIIIWSHAVMLNLPSAVIGVAALYHWRRWLDDPGSRHFYAASVLAPLAVLTYLPVAVLALVMCVWVLIAKRATLLFRRRTLAFAAIALIPLAVWALVDRKWAPSHGAAGLYLGQYPFWTAAAWSFYLKLLPRLVTVPLLLAVLTSVVAWLWTSRYRPELRYLFTWFAVCYVWFSAISVKEPRFVLLLVPPMVCLAVVGVVATLQSISHLTAQRSAGAIPLVLISLLLLSLRTAPFVQVPRVAGFEDIVAFISREAPSERVFYEGAYNGVFSFYVRAADQQLAQGIVLGSKLLYAMRMEPRYGLIERVSSAGDVVNVLRIACGCRLLVVERQVTRDTVSIRAVYHLRDALNSPQFRLVKSFRVDTPEVTDVDVYEQLGVLARPEYVELPFLVLGDGPTYKARPIERLP